MLRSAKVVISSDIVGLFQKFIRRGGAEVLTDLDLQCQYHLDLQCQYQYPELSSALQERITKLGEEAFAARLISSPIMKRRNLLTYIAN